MKHSSSGLYVLSAVASVVVFAGCGGSQAQIGAPSPVQPDAPFVAHQNHNLSSPSTKALPLVYIPTFAMGQVSVYSWHTGKVVQTLTGLHGPQGECIDNAGNIWITNTRTSRLVEYAHAGTTPIRSLSDKGAFPVGCTVASTTGDLAVSNASTAKGTPGSIAIFNGAHGKAKTYVDSAIPNPKFLTFDGKGNLFVEGTNGTSSALYAELRKGSATFTSVTLNKAIKYPSGLQWDGKYLAVGSGSTIYRISDGKIVGTTRLTKVGCNNSFFIAGSQIAALCSAAYSVSTFSYPAGGAPSRFFRLQNNPQLGKQFNLAISQ